MKKFISVVISLVFAVVIIPIANIEGNASTIGDCGVNVRWSFDSSEGILTISGSGKMMNFNNATTWGQNCSDIVNVVIENGVTSIGSNSFSACESLLNIYISSSVVEIFENAFLGCNNLKNIYYEGSESDWKNISIHSGNGILSNDKIKFNQKSIHECSFGEWRTINEPTCVAEGSKIRECSCGNKDVETIPATGIHNFEWKTSIEPTCTENGQEIQHCTICTAKGETRTINKLGHKSGDWVTEIEATCTDSGLKVKKCGNCGESLEKEPITPLGHSFGNWKVTVKENEEHDGEESRTCKSCKYTETRVIDNIQSSEKNIFGDADNDGKTSAKDARLVLQVVAGLKENKDLVFSNADVNKDNMITAVDARMILQIVAGIKLFG